MKRLSEQRLVVLLSLPIPSLRAATQIFPFQRAAAFSGSPRERREGRGRSETKGGRKERSGGFVQGSNVVNETLQGDAFCVRWISI